MNSKSPFAALDKALLGNHRPKNPDSPKESGQVATQFERQVLEPSTQSRQNPAADNDASLKDTMVPRDQDTIISSPENALFEKVRKSVKDLGKEAATYRFTKAEKNALNDIIHDCRKQDIRTSENEIARISINYLVQDYRQFGKSSVLMEILRRLHG